MTPTPDQRASVVAGVASAVTVAGMIATPLVPQRSRARRMLSSVVVGGMFVTTTANAARRWGTRRAGVAAAVTAVATGVVERVGTRTGLPFGRYAYTDALRPQIAHVPVIVPMAWFGMGLPSREAATAALGPFGGHAAARITLGSFAMTAWDLFLDPQMVGEGYWAWVRRGAYRGIPLSNFAGWFLTGLAIMAAFERLLPVEGGPTREEVPAGASASDSHRRSPSISHRRSSPADRGGAPADVRLVGEYGYMSIMQTLGFARFFRDPLVAVAGGLAMLPIAGAATAQLVRARR